MFTVQSAVAHGATVRRGDVLLQLEPEKIDRALTDLKAEVKLSELALRATEEELAAVEKITPLELEANQRAARMTEEDRKSYFDVIRPFTIKAEDFNLRMSQAQLEYEQEELRQLEKMYKADDITEETEAIVLKRRTTTWTAQILCRDEPGHSRSEPTVRHSARR